METDRSRIISYQRCPRERFLAYHHLGGLQRTRKSLPLQFGSAFHEGAEALLTAPGVEIAVSRAKVFLNDTFDAHSIAFDGEQPADVAAAMAYGREEQLALAEALLRAWWVHEGAAFLEQFEVIEVEREGRAELTQMRVNPRTHGNITTFDVDSLTLMFRPDALVRERASGDLYVVSWKTCATFGKRNVDQARHDMQSMSEVWGVEATHEGVVKVEGVLYKWVVKGRRSLDRYDNLYKQNSPLIYGWVKRGDTPEMDEWSWAYDFEKEDGSGVSRLGKGWRKVPIWREYEGGIRGWIDDLHRQSIFPRHLNALEQTFPVSTPVERRVDEVESWKRQVVAQEQQIGIALQELSQYPTPPVELVDELFPQYTHSCHSYSGCQFLPICWEGAPAEPGELYQIRLANHPEKGDEND